MIAKIAFLLNFVLYNWHWICLHSMSSGGPRGLVLPWLQYTYSVLPLSWVVTDRLNFSFSLNISRVFYSTPQLFTRESLLQRAVKHMFVLMSCRNTHFCYCYCLPMRTCKRFLCGRVIHVWNLIDGTRILWEMLNPYFAWLLNVSVRGRVSPSRKNVWTHPIV